MLSSAHLINIVEADVEVVLHGGVLHLVLLGARAVRVAPHVE